MLSIFLLFSPLLWWAEEEETHALAGVNVLTDTLPTTAFFRAFLRSGVQ